MSNIGQVFVAKLKRDCRVSELEEVFSKYGKLLRCDIKYGPTSAYAFVDYEDKRDADDAIKYENGREFLGERILVEFVTGRKSYSRTRTSSTTNGRRPYDSYGSGDSYTSRRDYSSNYRHDPYSSRSSRHDECHICRRSGHWAKDCPENRNNRTYRRRSRSQSYRSRSRSSSYGRGRRASRSRS